jgi:hypothetical protein
MLRRLPHRRRAKKPLLRLPRLRRKLSLNQSLRPAGKN